MIFTHNFILGIDHCIILFNKIENNDLDKLSLLYEFIDKEGKSIFNKKYLNLGLQQILSSFVEILINDINQFQVTNLLFIEKFHKMAKNLNQP